MSIRVKLALVLALTATAAVLASSRVFFTAQRGALRAAEEEKNALLIESVRAMAVEAQLARDPLMLIDYLDFLRRDRPEVLGARLRYAGSWRGAPPAAASESDANTLGLDVPASDGAGPVRVELHLSRAVLRARVADAERALGLALARSAAVVAFLGALLGVPLSWTLTRRIVELRRAAAEIGEGRLERRVDERGRDEIGGLARGMNAMAARLGEVDEMKKRFVSSVTHELRAPLFAIESYARIMLKESVLASADRERVVRVEQNAARLARFVTTLLDAARIERGKLDYSPRELDLEEVVRDVAAFHGERAKAEGRAIELSIGPGPHRAAADSDMLVMALTNLMANGLKFSPPGGKVVVSLRRTDAGHELAVADDGPGIDAVEQERLFLPFERLAAGKKVEGTGLGLSIVKTIVETHGGRVGVTSSPGKGARFHFTLPFA
ncbi:MAG: HAMP domain-containing sensor histidine kinase [Elusimicrobiota bacterium]|nr:HAMP domain-containing sensor histidine kinase [Elusimicrobiota bacterium]